MSYVRSVVKLVFADAEFAGLEVVCRRPSIGKLLRVRKLSRMQDDEQALDEMFEALAGAIVRWNVADELVDDDTGAVVAEIAVNPDKEGVASRDIGMVMAILNAWMDTTTTVAPPLPETSNSGGPSPEGFELMEALSSSPENSPTPDS